VLGCFCVARGPQAERGGRASLITPLHTLLPHLPSRHSTLEALLHAFAMPHCLGLVLYAVVPGTVWPSALCVKPQLATQIKTWFTPSKLHIRDAAPNVRSPCCPSGTASSLPTTRALKLNPLPSAEPQVANVGHLVHFILSSLRESFLFLFYIPSLEAAGRSKRTFLSSLSLLDLYFLTVPEELYFKMPVDAIHIAAVCK
jgi:hypothetical protein